MVQNTPEFFMNQALELAQEAALAGEVPVGALIVRNGEIVARARNEKESSNMATHHAEILAIEKASEILGKWRLTDCELYVSLEPCLMCCGAILQARVPQVYFGAKDPKFGAVESLYQTLTDERANHRCQVHGGIMAEKSAELLKTFFRERR
jgi:tRNA(adenine34) deaminase